MNNFTLKSNFMNALKQVKILSLLLSILSIGNFMNAQCIPDVNPPIAICEASLAVALGSDGTYTLPADALDEGSWDDCGGVEFRTSVYAGIFDPNDIPDAIEVTFNCCYIGTHVVMLWVLDEAGNSNVCWTEVEVEDKDDYCLSNPFDCTQKIISGNIFFDANQNCDYDAEDPLGIDKSVLVKRLPDGAFQYEANTDVNGYYEVILPFDDGADYEIRVKDINSYALSCGNQFVKKIPNGSNELTQHFPVRFETGCPFMIADISAPFLRRCFVNTVYVEACNYSDQFITDAYIDVNFDSFLGVVSSTLPGTPIGGNVYQYQLGSMEPGECFEFQVEVEVNCDAELGQTHCILANVFPQKECLETDPGWSGAIIQTSAICDGDSVQFIIENVGDGAMLQALEFVIVEDVVMYMEGEFELNSGEQHIEKVAANGTTWRLEATQAPGYPEWLAPASWVEGCGGLNNTGLVLEFPTGTNASSSTRFCLENQGAFDPNDKQSFPKGFGDNHYIKRNQDIDYLIRFQNTGTDTAFNIVIRDTLSDHLLWGSVRPGVSSHPYDFKTAGEGVLEFIFEDIMLPDSNVNEPNSHGFVQFKISQIPDLEDETVIENSAAIYFDFNEPIITNNTWLTVGADFVSANQKVFVDNFSVDIMPNPFHTSTLFKINGMSLQNGKLLILDAMGRTISQKTFSGNVFRLKGNELNSGLYFYQIVDDEELIVTGKLMVQCY